MPFQGAPDWSQPLAIPGGELYFAYEEPLRVLAPPLELRVAMEADGTPAISLDRIRIDAGGGKLTTFGLLTIRFGSEFALAERQHALFAIHPDAKVEPLVPRGGFLRFQSAEVLDIPAALLEPRPLLWSGAGSLTFAAQLDAESTSLLHSALTLGVLAVTAVVELETWGVASRVPSVVSFDPALIARWIGALARDGKCTASALVSRLAAASELAFTNAETAQARIAAATAFAERLIGRFAKLAPAGDPSSGATWAFDLAAMPAGEFTWDLAEALLVPKGMTVVSNPLDAARQALEKGIALVRDMPVIELATGLHVLSVYPNLPARRVGVLMLNTEVRVPPRLPERPQTVTGSATFRDGNAAKTIPIRLSPSEPVVFDYETIAFITEGGVARRLRGPVLRHEGLHLTIAPDSFPVRFVRVEATSALLDIATLQIRCSGLRGTVPWTAGAALDARTPALAVAVPRDVTDGTLSVVATARDGGRNVVLGPRPLEDCWLDLSTFPTAGPHRIDIVCEFDDGAGLAAIECAPEDRLEDASAFGLVPMTPTLREREWRWLVTNPLRDRYCWRWFHVETLSPWSAAVDPAAGALNLKSSSRLAAGAVS